MKFASFPEFVGGRSSSGSPEGDPQCGVEIGAEFLSARLSEFNHPAFVAPSTAAAAGLYLSPPPPRSLKWAGDPRSMLRWELSNTWRVPPEGGKCRLLSAAAADNRMHKSASGCPVLPPRSRWWSGGSDLGGGGKVAATVEPERRASSDGSSGWEIAVVVAGSQLRPADLPPPCL